MARAKTQRFLDLIAALLRHRYPVSLEQLREEVPEYGEGDPDSVRRKFERDKDELRGLGVDIETVPEREDGEAPGYRLTPAHFYLPYLAMRLGDGGAPVTPIQKYPYRQLGTLQFSADELRAVGEAARRVAEIGDASLAHEAVVAIRKLSLDLPLHGVLTAGTERLHGVHAHDPEVLDTLGAAVQRRKRVTFRYHSMGPDVTSERTVEPLGLFFLSRHWYLAARDDGAVKNFRISRISGVRAAPKPASPDFDVPADWSLRDHARHRHAWELGDEDLVQVEVALHGDTGAMDAARALGTPTGDDGVRHRFAVRRLDAFVRWLLPLGADARPLSPPALVAEWERLATATLALYPEPA